MKLFMESDLSAILLELNARAQIDFWCLMVSGSHEMSPAKRCGRLDRQFSSIYECAAAEDMLDTDKRLAALAATVARLEEAAASDRALLTSTLADAAQREKHNTEQIGQLQSTVQQHQLELNELRALHQTGGLHQQRPEGEQGVTATHAHPMQSEPMPATSSETLSWIEYASRARQCCERRAHKAYADYVKDSASNAMPSQSAPPASCSSNCTTLPQSDPSLDPHSAALAAGERLQLASVLLQLQVIHGKLARGSRSSVTV